MAARYQVRGRRIWDSETDTYSQLHESERHANRVIGWISAGECIVAFKPLAEWQDDKQESDPVEEPRYKAVGRRILDTKTDTWSKAWHDETMAAVIANWCNAANGGDVQFLSISEWDAVEKRVSDAVNHPPHYQGKVECIDAIASALGHDAFIAFLRGQVIKYMWRLGRKGDALEDAKKGKWYASRLVEELSK